MPRSTVGGRTNATMAIDVVRRVQMATNADDEADWTRLTDRYRPYIHRIALGILRNADDSEEVAQEVLLRMFRALERFEHRSTLSTWLYRITLNICLDRIAARRRDGAAWSRAVRELTSDGGDLLEHHLTDVALHAAVLALPPSYREVIRLHYFEDRPYREVAALVGVPLSGLKVRLHRARRALRAQLLGSQRPEKRRDGTTGPFPGLT